MSFKNIVVFFLLMFFGLFFGTKSINTDEGYTGTEMNYSYMSIWEGKIKEGCNSPIWYSLEKYVGGIGNGKLLSIFFISLAASLVGWYGLLMIPFLWPYFSEARPYGLVVLLVVIQYLALIKNNWKKVFWVNVAMSLTHSTLIIPIIASAVYFKKYVLLLPLVFIGCYYFVGEHYGFYLNNSAWLKIIALTGIGFLFFNNRFIFINVALSVAVMCFFGLKHSGNFQVSERYFIYLVPILTIGLIQKMSNKKYERQESS